MNPSTYVLIATFVIVLGLSVMAIVMLEKDTSTDIDWLWVAGAGVALVAGCIGYAWLRKKEMFANTVNTLMSAPLSTVARQVM